MASAPTLEKRILLFTTGSTLFGYLLLIISIATDYWVIVDIPMKETSQGGSFHTQTMSGIWRTCIVKLMNGTQHTSHSCMKHSLFPTDDELRKNSDLDSAMLGPFIPVSKGLLDFSRTQAAFSVIVILITLLGHAFAFYTIRRPRYILKRLTALLHAMTAGCVIVANEVFMNAITHASEFLPSRFPPNSEYHFGYSFIFSWIVFSIYVVATIVFLVSSHKRKHDMADSVDVYAAEDEPMQLSR